LEGFISRMQPCYWDHGVCIEGRGDGELPEVLLGGVRAFYWDFNNVDPFPARDLLPSKGGAGAAFSADSSDGDKQIASQPDVFEEEPPWGDVRRESRAGVMMEGAGEVGGVRAGDAGAQKQGPALPHDGAVRPTARRLTAQSSESFASASSLIAFSTNGEGVNTEAPQTVHGVARYSNGE
jgi:hypothetical protein